MKDEFYELMSNREFLSWAIYFEMRAEEEAEKLNKMMGNK